MNTKDLVHQIRRNRIPAPRTRVAAAPAKLPFYYTAAAALAPALLLGLVLMLAAAAPITS
jgi:hypothetical protein